MLSANNETPAPGPRGGSKNDLLSSAVASTCIRTVSGDQFATDERLVAEQNCCFSAACAYLACLVADGEYSEHWGRFEAKRVADQIGLTHAIGGNGVEALLNENFPAVLKRAHAGRINRRVAWTAFLNRLFAVFKAYRAVIVLRVQKGQIEPDKGADELDKFLHANCRLTAAVRRADLNRMASVTSLQQEGA